MRRGVVHPEPEILQPFGVDKRPALSAVEPSSIAEAKALHPSVVKRTWIRAKGHVLWVVVTLAAAVAVVLAAVAFAKTWDLSSHNLGNHIVCDPNLKRCVVESGVVLRMQSGDEATRADLQAGKQGMEITVTDATVGGPGSKATFFPDGTMKTSNAQTGATILNVNSSCLNQASSCNATG